MDSSISRGSFPEEEDDLGLQHNRNNGNAGQSKDIDIFIEKAIKGMIERKRFGSSNVGDTNYLQSEGVDQEECDSNVFGENRDTGINLSALTKPVGVAHNVKFETDHQYGYAAATAEEIRLGNEVSVNDSDSSVRKNFIDHESSDIDSDVLGSDDVSTEEVLDDLENRGQFEHLNISSLDDARKLSNDSVEELPLPDKCANVQNLKEDHRTFIKLKTNSSKNSDVNKPETISYPIVYKSNLPQTKNLRKSDSLKSFYESIGSNLADDDKNDLQEPSFLSPVDKMPELVNEKEVVVEFSEEDRPPPKLTPENNVTNEQVIGVVHPYNHENNLSIDNQCSNISGVSILSNSRKPLTPPTEVITRNRLRSHCLDSVINAPRSMIKKQEFYDAMILKHDSSKTMAIPTMLNGLVDKSDNINKEVNMRQGISSGNHYRSAHKGIKHVNNEDKKEFKNVNEFPFDSRFPFQIHSINKVPEKLKFSTYKFDDEEAYDHIADKSSSIQNKFITEGQPIVSGNIRKAVCDDQEIMKNNKSDTFYSLVCNVKTDTIVDNEKIKKSLRDNRLSLPSMPILLSPTTEETQTPIIKSNKGETSKKTDHTNMGRKHTPARSTATPLRSFQRLPITELTSLNPNKRTVLKHKKNSKPDELLLSVKTNYNTVFPVKHDMHNDIKAIGLEEYERQSEIDSNAQSTHFSLGKNELNEEMKKSVMKNAFNKKQLSNGFVKDIHSPDFISSPLETLTIETKDTDSSFKTFDNLLTDLDKAQTNSLDESVHSLDPFIKDIQPTSDILEVLPGADILDGGITDKEIIISSADSLLKSDILEEGQVSTYQSSALDDGTFSPILNFFDKDLTSSKVEESQENESIENPEKFSNKNDLSFTIPETKFEEDKVILDKPNDVNSINDEPFLFVEKNKLIDSIEEIGSKTISISDTSNHDQIKSEVLDNYVTAINKPKVFPITIAPEQNEYNDSKNNLFSEIEKIEQILDREWANSIGDKIISDRCSKNPSLSPLFLSTREEKQDCNKMRTAYVVIKRKLQEETMHEKSKLPEDCVIVSSEVTMGSCDSELSCKEVDVLKPEESSDHPEQNKIDGNYSSEQKNIIGIDDNTIDASMSDKKLKSDTSNCEDNGDDYLEDISDGDFEIVEDFEDINLPTRNNFTDGRNATINCKNTFYEIRTNVANSSQKHENRKVSLQRGVTKFHDGSNTKFSKDSLSFNISPSSYKNNNTYRGKGTRSYISYRKRTRASKKHQDPSSLKSPKKGNIFSSLQKGKQVPYSEGTKKHDSNTQFGATFPVVSKISATSDEFSNGRLSPSKVDGNDLLCRRHKNVIINTQDNICKRMQEDKASFSNIEVKDISLSPLEKSDLRNNLSDISKSNTVIKNRNEDILIVGGLTSTDEIEFSPRVNKECVNVKRKQMTSPQHNKKNEVKEKKAGLEDIIKKLKSEMKASDEYVDKWHIGESKMDLCVLKSNENAVTEPENSDSLLSCSSKIETEIIDDNLDAQLELELCPGKKNSIFHNSELKKFENHKGNVCSSNIETNVSDPVIAADENLPDSSEKDVYSNVICLTDASKETLSLISDDVNDDCNEKMILSSEKNNYISSTSSTVASKSSIHDSSSKCIQENQTFSENKLRIYDIKGEMSSSLGLVSKNSESKSSGNGVHSVTSSEFVTDKICTSESEFIKKDMDLIKTNENCNEPHVLNKIETEKLNECVTINDINKVNADSNSSENENNLNNFLSKLPVNKNSAINEQKSLSVLITKSSPLLNSSCGNNIVSEIKVDFSCQKAGFQHKKKDQNSPAELPIITNKKIHEIVSAAATESCRKRERNDNSSLIVKQKSETENILRTPSDAATKKKDKDLNMLNNLSGEVQKSIRSINDEQILQTSQSYLQVLNKVENNKDIAVMGLANCQNINLANNVSNSVTKTIYENLATDFVEPMVDLNNANSANERSQLESCKKTFIENTITSQDIEADNQSVGGNENFINVTKTDQIINITEKDETNVQPTLRCVSDDENSTNVTEKIGYPSCIENAPTDHKNGINATEKTFIEKLQNTERVNDKTNVIDVTQTTNQIINITETTEKTFSVHTESTGKPQSAESVNLTVSDDKNGINVTEATYSTLCIESVIPTVCAGNSIDDTAAIFTEKLLSIESASDHKSGMNVSETTVTTEKTFSVNNKSSEKSLNIESVNLTVSDDENGINVSDKTNKIINVTEITDNTLGTENVIPTLSDENCIDDTEKSFTEKLQSIDSVNDETNFIDVTETTNQVISVTETTEKTFSGSTEKPPSIEIVNLTISDAQNCINVSNQNNQIINVTEITESTENTLCIENIVPTVRDENGIDDTGETFTGKLQSIESFSDDKKGMNANETTNQIINVTKTTDITEKILSVNNESSEKPLNIENVNLIVSDDENGTNATDKTNKMINVTEITKTTDNISCIENVIPIVSDDNGIDGTKTNKITNVSEIIKIVGNTLSIENVIPTVSDENGIDDTDKTFTEKQSIESVNDETYVIDATEATNQVINVAETTEATEKTFPESNEKPPSIESVNLTVSDDENGIDNTEESYTEKLLSIENVSDDKNSMNAAEATNKIINVTETTDTTKKTFSANNECSEKPMSIESVNLTISDNEYGINVSGKTFTETANRLQCVESVNPTVNSEENSMNANENTFTENADKPQSVENISRAFTDAKHNINASEKTFTENTDKTLSLGIVNQTISDDENSINTNENTEKTSGTESVNHTVSGDGNVINVTEKIFTENADKRLCIYESVNPTVSDGKKGVNVSLTLEISTIPIENTDNEKIINDKNDEALMNEIECDPGITSKSPLVSSHEKILISDSNTSIEDQSKKSNETDKLAFINMVVSEINSKNEIEKSQKLSHFKQNNLKKSLFSGPKAGKNNNVKRKKSSDLTSELSKSEMSIDVEKENPTELINSQISGPESVNRSDDFQPSLTLGDLSTETHSVFPSDPLSSKFSSPLIESAACSNGSKSPDEEKVIEKLTVDSLVDDLSSPSITIRDEANSDTELNNLESAEGINEHLTNSSSKVLKRNASNECIKTIYSDKFLNESTVVIISDPHGSRTSSIMTDKNELVPENLLNNSLSPPLLTYEDSISDKPLNNRDNVAESKTHCDIAVENVNQKLNSKPTVPLQGSDLVEVKFPLINNYDSSENDRCVKSIDFNKFIKNDNMKIMNSSKQFGPQVNYNPENFIQEFAKYIDLNNKFQIERVVAREENQSLLVINDNSGPSNNYQSDEVIASGNSPESIDQENKIEEIAPVNLKPEVNSLKEKRFPSNCSAIDNTKPSIGTTDSNLSNNNDVKPIEYSEINTESSKNEVVQLPVGDYSESEVAKHNSDFAIGNDNLKAYSTLSSQVSRNLCPSENQPVISNDSDAIGTAIVQPLSGSTGLKQSHLDNIITTKKGLQLGNVINKLASDTKTEESATEHSNYSAADSLEEKIINEEEHTKGTSTDTPNEQENVVTRNREHSCSKNHSNMASSNREDKLKSEGTEEFSVILEHGSLIEEKFQYAGSCKSDIHRMPEEMNESEVTDSIELSPQSNLTCPDCTEPNSGTVKKSENLKKSKSEPIEDKNLRQSDDSDGKQLESASNVIVANYFQSSILVKPMDSKIPLLEKSEIDKIIVNERDDSDKTDFIVNTINLEKTPRVFSKDEVLSEVNENNIVSSSIDQNNKVGNKLKLDKQYEVNKVDINKKTGTLVNIETNSNNLKKMGLHDSISCDADITDEIVETNSADSVLSKATQELAENYVKDVRIVLKKIDFPNNSSSIKCIANAESTVQKRKRQILDHSEGVKRNSNTLYDQEEPPSKILLLHSPKLVDDARFVNKNKKVQRRINLRSKSTVFRNVKTEINTFGNLCPSVILSALDSFRSIRECSHKNKVKRAFIPSNIYNSLKKDTCQPSIYHDVEIICTESNDRYSRFKRRRRKSPLSRTDDENHSSKTRLKRSSRRLDKRTAQDKALNSIQNQTNVNDPSLLSVNIEKSTKVKSLSESSSFHERTIRSSISAALSTSKRHHESEICNEASPKRPNLDNKVSCSYNKPETVNYLTIEKPIFAQDSPFTLTTAGSQIEAEVPVASCSTGHHAVLKVRGTMKEILYNVVWKRLNQAVGIPENEEDSDDDFMGFEDELPCGCSLESNSISQSCVGNCFIRRKLCYLKRTIELSSKHPSSRRNERLRTFRPSWPDSGEEQDQLRGDKNIKLHREASSSAKPFRDPGICYVSLGVRSQKSEDKQDCSTSKNVEVRNNWKTRLAQLDKRPSSITETDNQEEDSDSLS